MARTASGLFIARSASSTGPNIQNVTNAPAAIKATSFTMDSVATASIRPCWCSVASVWRVPNSTAKAAIAKVTVSAMSPTIGILENAWSSLRMVSSEEAIAIARHQEKEPDVAEGGCDHAPVVQHRCLLHTRLNPAANEDRRLQASIAGLGRQSTLRGRSRAGFRRGCEARQLFGRERFFLQGQVETLPNLQQGLGELIDQDVIMVRGGRDAQPLSAFGDRRIVDRLYVDAVLFEQDVARPLAIFGVAHEQRHDVGVARHHRQASGGQDRLDAGGAILMTLPLPI